MELCDLRLELEPWSNEEVESFVRNSLTTAACSPDLFTEACIRRLAELTDGIPRRVQQLAQLSLVAAAAQDLDEIDEDTLDTVQQELSATTWT
jgi:type II secretory pathway predicted ATPase ExeA